VLNPRPARDCIQIFTGPIEHLSFMVDMLPAGGSI
jgi:putative heme degradation protein